ncbi:hypothetical protein MUN88_19780 [Gracilibacillus caseinilyticus]|uniref:Uncharacterized protein n=1 Tax=Gracilibacillus caseinilyticus TaxID=2932256 RepID=A0ABY4EV05_9BACI|nr:hypothetical protein [Gracilibacillus caseinilyticus]UOQ48250.1 hypothetical protein MUN88_19780 [Gracilibacillus caseinilyticus]
MKLKSIAKKGAKAWMNMDPAKKDKIKREVSKKVKNKSANKMIKKFFK